MNKEDLALFVEKSKKYKVMISSADKDIAKEKAARLHARRSIVAVRDIMIDEIISEEMIIAKRPAHGISPIHWDDVVGMKVVVDLKEDELIKWESLV